MSSHDDYEQMFPAINAIPEADVRSPALPVGAFLQEAENLYHWARQDEATLTGAGLDWTWVTDLPVRAGALRAAEGTWFKKRFSREETVQLWEKDSDAGYALRDRLLHDFRYAYRKHPQLLSRVSQIADGTGHADMIQDLFNISVLGHEHIEDLRAINLDLGLLDKASSTSDHLADLLAQANVNREEAAGSLMIRDRAYTHLKEAVDEVRACGQYVFVSDEERFHGYISLYHKKANTRKRKSEPGTPEAEPTT